MGLAPEVLLVVKHTFLEFVEASGNKSARGRAFTDTDLLKNSETSSTDEISSADSCADRAIVDKHEMEQESPVWPSTPVLEPADKPNTWWNGKELVDLEATMEVKAVLGMTPQPQAMAWWWLPSDLALSLETMDDRSEMFAGLPPQATLVGAVPATSSMASPHGCYTDAGLFGTAAASSEETAEAPEQPRTTVMIRNLPHTCGRDDLLEVLDRKGFAGQYDFVYVPVDFGTGSGLGYAFVDLVTPEAAAQVWSTFEGLNEWPVPSADACTVCWSNPHQGFPAHVERYMNSPVMHHTVPEAWKPALFMNGVRVPFPQPTKAIKAPKAPRSRRAEAA